LARSGAIGLLIGFALSHAAYAQVVNANDGPSLDAGLGGDPSGSGMVRPGDPMSTFDALAQPSNDTIYPAVTSTTVINAQQVNGVILGRLGNHLAVTARRREQTGASSAGGSASTSLESLVTEGGWFQGVGAFAALDGNAAAPGFVSKSGGFVGGYDRSVAENIYLGIAVSYLHSNIDEHSTSRGSGSSARLALYGGTSVGPSLLTATVGYARDGFDTVRGIAGIGTAIEDHAGYETSAGTQWSLPLSFPAFGNGSATFTPEAGLQFVHVMEDGFGETGGDDFNLSASGRGTDSFQPYLTAKLAQEFNTEAGDAVIPELRLGFAHEVLNNLRLLTVSTAGGVAFPTAGLEPARSQLSGGLGVTVQTGANLYLYADYDAVLPTGNTVIHTIQAGLHWRF
jgi:outer membrane autotransporter protein